MQKKELGKKGEEKAFVLEKKGYRIIEQNYVCDLARWTSLPERRILWSSSK